MAVVGYPKNRLITTVDGTAFIQKSAGCGILTATFLYVCPENDERQFH